jgi:hypothetical protein
MDIINVLIAHDKKISTNKLLITSNHCIIYAQYVNN